MKKEKPKSPLQKLIQLEEDARSFGFEWETQQMLCDQVISESQEVISAIQGNEGSERVQEEIGDVIHSAIAWCLFAGYNVEETIQKVNKKFEHRMKALKEIAQARQLTSLKEQPMSFLLELWEEAKKKSSHKP